MDDLQKKNIVVKFSENGLIISSHGFERILQNNLNIDDVIKKAREREIWLITDEFIQESVVSTKKERYGAVLPKKAFYKEKPKQEIVEEKKTDVIVERTKPIFAKEIEPQLKIFDYTDVTEKSSCEGTLENFVEYFNEKYKSLSEIVREHMNYQYATPIEAIKKNNRNEGSIKIIGIVTSKRESKRGHKFIDIEDPSGSLTIFIPQDNRALNTIYSQIVQDEVVGIEGRLHNELFIANDITQPELPLSHTMTTADEPVHMALISDMHIGSYLFLEREFQNFINWIKSANGSEVSEKIKYILVAGDLVDGIGVYPDQERELTIPDIYKQYNFLATLLEQIPDYIEIILSIGNHDAVRLAEPQPKLPKDIGAPLYNMQNVHMVGNPIMISTHGVKTLMYHGTTLDTIIGNIPGCSYSAPENAMVHYLKRRHLAPIYGNDQILPEKRDYMAIKEIPDILHCGHVHTNGVTTYRGVKVINSGTFQAKTKYQEQLGHQPTPAKVPVINLQNFEVSVLNFS